MSFLGVGTKLGVSLSARNRLGLSVNCRKFCNGIWSHPATFLSSRLFTSSAADSEYLAGLGPKKTRERKKKVSAKSHKKLHSRVFSQEERLENKRYLQNFSSDLEESDSFGTLQTRVETENQEMKQRIKPWTLQSETTHRDFRSVQGPAVAHASAKHRVEVPERVRQNDGWTDTFGTLQENNLEERIKESLYTKVGSHEERFSEDEEWDTERVRLSAENRRHIPEWYGRQILKLGKKGQIRDAIKIFDDWMLQKDRVMPNAYVFTCLITVLGRAGYTQKAFSLFNKMKSMDITPKPATYTALFNACANSPWKQDGRARADNLYRLMKEKGVEPTFITGKAMVKAFAVCGDLRRTFQLVDELSQVYRPDQEVFSFLLMACISDKDAGLCHAIQVWRLMQQMGVRPDLPLYNLLIRCVRDCGIGDVATFTSMLTEDERAMAGTNNNRNVESLKESPSRHYELDSGMLTLQATDTQREESLDSNSSKKALSLFDSSSVNSNCPSTSTEIAFSSGNDSHRFQNNDDLTETNLLDKRHTTSSSDLTVFSSTSIPDVLSPACAASRLVSLGELSTKEQRLLLLGGVGGVLARMAKDRAAPDIITFSQLVSVAMPTVEEEQQLLERMRTLKVKPDVDFVNTLIHKRCMRGDFAAAKEAGNLLMDNGLTASLRTYGVLAMTCKTVGDASRLLKDMETANLAPNIEIMGTLMYAAGISFAHKLWVLRQVQKLDLRPNNKFLENIESSLLFARRKMVEAEKQKKHESFFQSAKFQENLENFVQQYEAWLQQIQVQVPSHPWAPFKPTQTDNRGVTST